MRLAPMARRRDRPARPARPAGPAWPAGLAGPASEKAAARGMEWLQRRRGLAGLAWIGAGAGSDGRRLGDCIRAVDGSAAVPRCLAAAGRPGGVGGEFCLAAGEGKIPAYVRAYVRACVRVYVLCV